MMMRSLLRPAIVIVLAVAASLPVVAQVTLPIRMRAFAVNMSNNLTGANGILEITVDKWSTAEERTNLLAVVPKGQDALISALQKLSAKGRIRIPGWMGPDPQNYRLGW